MKNVRKRCFRKQERSFTCSKIGVNIWFTGPILYNENDVGGGLGKPKKVKASL